MSSVLAIIPARGGSKGIPRKNIRPLAGRPLLAYTVAAAQASTRITRLVVSTEDAEIAAVARELGCEVVPRPPELATDDAPTIPVLLHAVETLRAQGHVFEIVLLLQPTAPLRTTQDIEASLDRLESRQANAVVSVCRVPGHYHPDWQFAVDEAGTLRLYNGQGLDQLIPRRQLLGATYTRNGAIYAVRSAYLLAHRRLLAPDTLAYEMPPERSVNLDSELDWVAAEYLLARAQA